MTKTEFFNQNRRFNTSEWNKINKYCKEFWPNDVDHVLRVANDVCNNKFLFDNPWDMERTYDTVKFTGEINWYLILAKDREFCWQFNRHRFFISLGQAYQLTGNEEYAKTYVNLVKDWIKRVRIESDPDIDMGPLRTLEIGIRGETWTQSILYFENSKWIDDEFIALFCNSLMEQARRLRDNFLYHKYVSNWGVIESSGLFLISQTLPADYDSVDSFQKVALERLEIAARVQVMGDGTQWEQSPMYHNEVYHYFLIALLRAQISNIPIPDVLLQVVKKMAYANLAWIKPNHCQFAQGDSDETDLRDKLTAGACLFHDPVLKYVAYPRIDFENVWLFGYNVCETYNKLDSKYPPFISKALDDSGNYYMRENWQSNANLLHFHCGDMGGAHGHADKLHFDLVIHGEDVLVDSGRFTYMEENNRYFLKGTFGHNITIVDEKPFTQIQDSWVCKKLSTAIKHPFKDGELGALVQGSHLGYLDMGVFVNRKIIWIKPDIYIIVDELYSNDNHVYKNYYHFSRDGEVKKTNEVVHFIGSGMEAFIQILGVDSLNIIDTIQSKYYNEYKENKTLICAKEGNGFTSIVTVINGGEKDKTNPVTVTKVPVLSVTHNNYFDENKVEALKIQNAGKTYIIIFCHEEIFTPADLAKVENCIGYGNVILFEQGNHSEILTGEVLAF